MNAAFVDTGYILALELVNDQNHGAAGRHWQTVTPALPRLFTTSYVFAEITTYFNSRGLHAKAVSVGNMLLRSPALQIVHVNEPLFFDGWNYFQQHQDKTYSLTDCISFVVMKKHGVDQAFAFDKHFEQAGFIRLP